MRVRLSDIDPKVRLAAAQRLIRRECLDGDAAMEVFAAALKPSDRWYVVSEEGQVMLPFITSGHRGMLGSPASGADT